jgi:hypothetical protein
MRALARADPQLQSGRGRKGKGGVARLPKKQNTGGLIAAPVFETPSRPKTRAAIVGLIALPQEPQNAPSSTALTNANTANTARTLSFKETSIRPPLAVLD